MNDSLCVVGPNRVLETHLSGPGPQNDRGQRPKNPWIDQKMSRAKRVNLLVLLCSAGRGFVRRLGLHDVFLHYKTLRTVIKVHSVG